MAALTRRTRRNKPEMKASAPAEVFISVNFPPKADTGLLPPPKA